MMYFKLFSCALCGICCYVETLFIVSRFGAIVELGKVGYKFNKQISKTQELTLVLLVSV